MAYARLTAFPPLNQLTVIPAEQTQIRFTAYLRWNLVRPKYPIDVALCHITSDVSEHQSRWTVVPLTQTDEPWNIGHNDVHEACFETSLPRTTFVSNGMIYVTYKYRIGPRSPWLWVETQQGICPSRIVLQTSLTGPDRSLSYFLDLSPGWKEPELANSSQSVITFRLESTASIPRVIESEEENELAEHVLGTIRNQIQYMALIRLEPYWIGPRQGRDYFHLSEDAVLCSFLGAAGQVVTVLTTTGIDEVYSVIRSNNNGDVVIAARCDADKDVPFHCFVAIANTIEDSISAVMGAAREAVNGQPQYQQLANDSSRADNSHTSIESWYDGLVFCTWNALGQNLSESKILDALSSLANNNIRISTLLIDNNWQVLGPIPDHDYSDSFNRGLCELTANSTVAPNGLQSLTSKIRSLHPHVTDIGVWHALMGYWGGISPSGMIAKNYNTVEVASYLMGEIPATITSIAPDDLPRFYNDLYSYLSTSGMTFVKTDVQHMLSTFRTPHARRTLIPAYQSAWSTSCARHFSGKGISCMSQIPELLFSSLLQSHGARVLARNSDDFYPEVSASHPWHVWTNAHNALLTRHLNVLPDWDMFQSSHPYSAYHAAARCVSGGPVTITDVPGEHDTALLRQVAALDPRGRSIALRPNVAAVLGGFEEYMAGNALKVATTTEAGYALLGLWNVVEHPASVLVPVSDFPGLRDGVIVYNYRSKQVLGLFDMPVSRKEGVSSADLIFCELEVRGWEVLTACPVQTIRTGSGSVALAVLGLTDKISGAAAIIHTSSLSLSSSASDSAAMSTDAKLELQIQLKALGKLGLYLSTSLEATPTLKLDLLLPSQSHMAESKNISCEKINVVRSGSDAQAWLFTVDLESEWFEKGLFSLGSETVEIGIRIVLGVDE